MRSATPRVKGAGRHAQFPDAPAREFSARATFGEGSTSRNTPVTAGHGRKAAFQRAGASHRILPTIELDR